MTILVKDKLFNVDKINRLANELKVAYIDFDSNGFKLYIMNDLNKLELKARIELITDALYKYLPQDFKLATRIIKKALPEELDNSQSDNDFGDFIYAPYSNYIARYGCNDQYYKLSMNMIEEITKRFSCEYAIRNFINNYSKETLIYLEKFARSKNYHVRRLASEGSRPKLPWASKISVNYKYADKILKLLAYDNCAYVYRSVANHLNDISKIDADYVIDFIDNLNKTKVKDYKYFINHALRTLIKNKNPKAMLLLGYNKLKYESVKLNMSDSFTLNQELNFTFNIKFKKRTKAIILYKLYFPLSENKSVIRNYILYRGDNEDIVTVSKKHKLDTDISTFKIRKGKGKIEIILNGVTIVNKIFNIDN